MDRAVIYARYSSSSQDEQTIEVQLKQCRIYAQKHNMKIVKEYIDEAKTGRNAKRAGLQNLIFDSGKKEFKYVIIYMSDRFFRNAQEALGAEYMLRENGVKICYTNVEYPDNAIGRFMRLVEYGQDELYSDTYAEKIQKGIEHKASQFKSLGSNVPFGYKSVDREIVLDDEMVPYVKEIFNMYASGKKYADIYNYLNAMGVKTKRGGSFNKSSIGRILQNKTYIGTYTFKGMETPDVLPRVIDDDLFYRVQGMIAKTKLLPSKHKAEEEYILSDKLLCPCCRSKMTGYSGTSKSKRLYKYYKCKNPKCPGNSKEIVIPKGEIEDKIFNVVKNFLNAKVIDKIIDSVIKKCKENNETNELRQLIRAIDDNTRKKKNTLEAITECGDLDIRKTLYEKLRELETHRVELNCKRIEVENQHIKLDRDQVEMFIKKMKTTCSISNKRIIVNTLVEKIYLCRDYAIVNLVLSPIGVIVPFNDNKPFFKHRCSFFVANAPPYENKKNPVYIGAGFVAIKIPIKCVNKIKKRR